MFIYFYICTCICHVHTCLYIFRTVCTCLYISRKVCTCLNHEFGVYVLQHSTYTSYTWFRHAYTRLCQVVRIPDSDGYKKNIWFLVSLNPLWCQSENKLSDVIWYTASIPYMIFVKSYDHRMSQENYDIIIANFKLN
jgi:hypothetical protein